MQGAAPVISCRGRHKEGDHEYLRSGRNWSCHWCGQSFDGVLKECPPTAAPAIWCRTCKCTRRLARAVCAMCQQQWNHCKCAAPSGAVTIADGISDAGTNPQRERHGKRPARTHSHDECRRPKRTLVCTRNDDQNRDGAPHPDERPSRASPVATEALRSRAPSTHAQQRTHDDRRGPADLELRMDRNVENGAAHLTFHPCAAKQFRSCESGTGGVAADLSNADISGEGEPYPDEQPSRAGPTATEALRGRTPRMHSSRVRPRNMEQGHQRAHEDQSCRDDSRPGTVRTNEHDTAYPIARPCTAKRAKFGESGTAECDHSVEAALHRGSDNERRAATQSEHAVYHCSMERRGSQPAADWESAMREAGPTTKEPAPRQESHSMDGMHTPAEDHVYAVTTGPRKGELVRDTREPSGTSHRSEEWHNAAGENIANRTHEPRCTHTERGKVAGQAPIAAEPLHGVTDGARRGGTRQHHEEAQHSALRGRETGAIGTVPKRAARSSERSCAIEPDTKAGFSNAHSKRGRKRNAAAATQRSHAAPQPRNGASKRRLDNPGSAREEQVRRGRYSKAEPLQHYGCHTPEEERSKGDAPFISRVSASSQRDVADIARRGENKSPTMDTGGGCEFTSHGEPIPDREKSVSRRAHSGQKSKRTAAPYPPAPSRKCSRLGAFRVSSLRHHCSSCRPRPSGARKEPRDTGNVLAQRGPGPAKQSLAARGWHHRWPPPPPPPGAAKRRRTDGYARS